MHLVFLNQYYPPDAAPTGLMLQAVAEELARQGHRVTVICADGGYASVAAASFPDPPGRGTAPPPGGGESGRARGVEVVRIGATQFGRGRFLGKLADYLSYYLGTGWKLLRSDRPDRVVALTTPPYLSVLARLASRIRGGDHAHWVMDLYPDVMAAHGMLPSSSVRYRALQSMARWGFGGSRAACLLTLGPDMARALAAYQGAAAKDGVHWVPLWASAQPAAGEAVRSGAVETLRRARGWKPEETVVMYSGNMGLGHQFDEILEAARVLAAPDETGKASPGTFRFVFYGGGKRRQEVERFIETHPGWRVELHGYVPAGELDIHLRTADVHLVSLRPEWTGTMVPSKLQGIFTVERPVLFVGGPTSSIGEWILESGGGWVIPPGGTAGIVTVLREAAAEPGEFARRGRQAASFAQTRFLQSTNVRSIAVLLSRNTAE